MSVSKLKQRVCKLSQVSLYLDFLFKYSGFVSTQLQYINTDYTHSKHIEVKGTLHSVLRTRGICLHFLFTLNLVPILQHALVIL